ncbi:MAG: AbrB/MazE/SpoVT family DNA-binding domain-containing protein [Candidatus Nomurabacteria bacterium]|jgi:AbrB family looped-hinge helix DNA binding protein|nr:AbrB/MazE/SpoVT family DNA-binding domain-containing protein [Candidatus Nomurabacteria bacterium]
MNLVRLSSNGQITVPAEIRKLLRLRSGDKILLFQNKSGEVVIDNASAGALHKAQNAMSGVAKRLGLHSENDVQKLVDEVRYGENRA